MQDPKVSFLVSILIFVISEQWKGDNEAPVYAPKESHIQWDSSAFFI